MTPARCLAAMLLSASLGVAPSDAQVTFGSIASVSLDGALAQINQPSDVSSGTLALTLDDAVRRALEHNPDLELVRLGTEIELERVAESRGAFAPVFSATLGRSSVTTPPSNFLLGDAGVSVRDWFTSTGVRQRLVQGGGTWRIGWDTSRTSTNNPLTSFDPSLQSGLQVAFSQPLLRDRTVDPARHQYVITSRNLETSELQYRESVVQTVAAVKEAYWTLEALAANVTVQQRSLELAEELVRQNRVRVDLGQAPELDLLQAEVEVAQRRETLIRATADAEDAEDRLRRLIMDPEEVAFWRMQLDPVDEPNGGEPLPDIDAVVAQALDTRYDIARARNDLANADDTVTFYTNQRLPDIRLELSYAGNGLGGTQLVRTGEFPGIVTGRLNSSFGSVLNHVFTNDYPTWSAGITVTHSLGRSYEDAARARSAIERQQAAHRIASLQLNAAQAIRQAARQVRSTAERIDAARAGATLAEERLNTEQRRYEAGLSTSFLVTQAQRDLVEAQVDLLQATLDHQSAVVSFEALQEAPPLGEGEQIGLNGSSITRMQTPVPSGIFRQGGGTGLP